MKNMTKALFAVLLLALAAGARAEDKYDQLARELTEAGASVQGKKIAIIPFSYADTKDKASKDGSVIAERLAVKMINMHKFEVIERSALDKVMNELKLQSSGIMDANSTQQLGKLLGVEAIITGTLVQTSGGQIEVNARLIKTETAQAIGASQVTLDKNWIGDDNAVPQQAQQVQQPEPQAYQQPSQPMVKQAARARGPNEYGYFDVIAGAGTQTTDITWDAYRSNIKQTGLLTSGAGPIGFRVGGYGNGAFGGDFEFSVSRHYIDSQRGTVVNNTILYNAVIPAGYLDVTSVGMSGDLLLRTMTKAQFYFGLGLGLSINNIKSSVLRDVRNALLNETAVGFMFRVPVGVRFNMDSTTFFLEWRAEMNSTSFNGGYAGVTNNVTFTGSRFVLGVGSKF